MPRRSSASSPARPRRPRAASAFPTQQQLLLPLLETLDALGGTGTPRAVADALAEHVGLTPEARAQRTHAGVAGEINAWDREVRWTRQRAVLQGHVASPRRGIWELTEEGTNNLRNIRPGLVITVYETAQGTALWAECEAAVSLLARDSVNLICTSPPYPLNRRKDYAFQLSVNEHVDWLLRCAEGWKDVLAEDGSLFLNIADVWTPGQPTQSLYQEKLLLRLCEDLGYHLAQRMYWHNPAKLPSPGQWVTIKRVRVTPAVEQVYWLSKTPHPKANNRNTLRAYSQRMEALLAKGGESRKARPSGHVLSEGGFGANNGGSIAHNILTLPNTSSNDAYQRRCRAEGLPIHPARFPAGLPEFAIRHCTDPGDLVWDPFGGSGQTAEVCERLGRRWILSEKSLTYARGSAFRVDGAPGFTSYFDRLDEDAA